MEHRELPRNVSATKEERDAAFEYAYGPLGTPVDHPAFTTGSGMYGDWLKLQNAIDS